MEMEQNQTFPPVSREEFLPKLQFARRASEIGDFSRADEEFRDLLKTLLSTEQLASLFDTPLPPPIIEQGSVKLQSPQEDPFPWLENPTRTQVYECLCGIAANMRDGSNHRGAIPFADRASRLEPSQVQAWVILGFCFNTEFEFRRSLACFHTAMNLAGPDGSLWYNIGQANFRLHRFREAELALKNSLEFSKSEFQPYYYLGLILRIEGKIEESNTYFQQAFDWAAKKGTDSLLAFARLCDEDGIADWEEKAADECIDRDPFSDLAIRMKALVLQHAGNFSEAEACLRTAIQWNPDNAVLYQDIATGRKMTTDDIPFIEEIERKLKAPSLAIASQKALNYSLGKTYDDLKDYKKAMHHFDLANQNARAEVGRSALNQEEYDHYVNELIRFNTPDRISQWSGYGSSSLKPILIVGMIRSGTTLCEQIISSHPDVGGAGELQFLRSRNFWAQENETESQIAENIQEYAQDYLDLLSSYAPDKPRVTDKMPLNYSHLGSFVIAFPKAKIIHMRRSPFDTCLSMYVTPFTPNLNYGHDQDSIVNFYLGYLKIMSHWRNILPKDTFLEVNYEDIVADKETQLRRITEFLGLEWNDSVLTHNENRREIHTPSQWQARQPIYKTSVNRYQNYAPYLGGLKKLMEPGFLDALNSSP